MSNRALTWAFELAIRPSWVKFVLVAMADVASETGVAFPSIAHLAAATCEDRKTVIGAIAKLEAMGFVADSGERRGRTRQVKVYQMALERKSAIDGTIGTVPEAGQLGPDQKKGRVPPNLGKSPVQGPKESRRRDTEPLEPPMTPHSKVGPDVPTPGDLGLEMPPARNLELAALQIYNDCARRVGWPQANILTGVRKRTLGARLRDCGGLDGFRAVMAKAEASPFLTGRTAPNESHANWRCDLDFLLREAKFTKLREGGYDDRAAPKRSQPRGGFNQ